MTNSDYTHLALIVDRSGSMQGIARDMNGGIAQLLKDQGELPGELHVDITTFDTVIERPYINARVDDIKGEIISPRGGTALLDAVGVTASKLGEYFDSLKEEDRPGKVIVVIVTDGQENSSREWTEKAVKDLVEKQQNEFSWEFLFLGANIDSFATAASFGIPKGRAMDFDYSGQGAVFAASSISGYATRSRLDGDTTGFTEEEQAGA